MYYLVPWLFDMIHDGYANTCALKDYSLTLAPLPAHKPLKSKLGKGSQKSLYISETQEEEPLVRESLYLL